MRVLATVTLSLSLKALWERSLVMCAVTGQKQLTVDQAERVCLNTAIGYMVEQL